VFVGRLNFRASKLLLSLLIAGPVSTAFAASILPSCQPGTVASYVASTGYPGGGCSIGILDYYQFSYVTRHGGNAPIDTAIAVNPEANGFSFGPVSAAPFTTVTFEIDYDIVIDPVPRIPGASLNIDPPIGDVVVTEYFCNDVEYKPTGNCLGSVAPSLTVGTPASGYPSSAQINFANPAAVSQEVGIVFTLTGGATGASFDGLDAVSLVSSVPEPAPVAALLLGLLTLGGGYLGKARARKRLGSAPAIR
jgi:hypothetical protein